MRLQDLKSDILNDYTTKVKQLRNLDEYFEEKVKEVLNMNR